MLIALLIALIFLWFLGYISIPAIPIPDLTFYTLNGHPITLWNLLILLVLIGVATSLPSPLREILFVVIILWVLSVLGIIAFVGLPSIIIIAIIAGLVVFLIQGRTSL
jgi:hypothetical protein